MVLHCCPFFFDFFWLFLKKQEKMGFKKQQKRGQKWPRNGKGGNLVHTCAQVVLQFRFWGCFWEVFDLSYVSEWGLIWPLLFSYIADQVVFFSKKQPFFGSLGKNPKNRLKRIYVQFLICQKHEKSKKQQKTAKNEQKINFRVFFCYIGEEILKLNLCTNILLRV